MRMESNITFGTANLAHFEPGRLTYADAVRAEEQRRHGGCSWLNEETFEGRIHGWRCAVDRAKDSQARVPLREPQPISAARGPGVTPPQGASDYIDRPLPPMPAGAARRDSSPTSGRQTSTNTSPPRFLLKLESTWGEDEKMLAMRSYERAYSTPSDDRRN